MKKAESLLGTIKKGEVVTLPDGTVCVLLVHAATATPPSNVARIVPSMSILPSCGCRLDPSDAAVVGPPAGGRKIAMLGDTCGSPAIAAAAAGAHLLIHEVRTLRVAAGWGGMAHDTCVLGFFIQCTNAKTAEDAAPYAEVRPTVPCV